MDFVKLVKKSRPNIKENSAQAYARSLKLLAPEDATSLDFLRDTDAIIQKLDKYKNSTKRNYLNAVIVILKGVPEAEPALKEYEKLRVREHYLDGYREGYLERDEAERLADAAEKKIMEAAPAPEPEEGTVSSESSWW